MTSYKKINIASGNIIDYKVTSPNNHCYQIHILAGGRPVTLIKICCFLFLRQEHVKVSIFSH